MVVRIQCFHGSNLGSILGMGTEIPCQVKKHSSQLLPPHPHPKKKAQKSSFFWLPRGIWSSWALISWDLRNSCSNAGSLTQPGDQTCNLVLQRHCLSCGHSGNSSTGILKTVLSNFKFLSLLQPLEPLISTTRPFLVLLVSFLFQEMSKSLFHFKVFVAAVSSV